MMNFDVEKATNEEIPKRSSLCFDWSGSVRCRRVLSLRHTTTLNTHPKRTPHYKIRFVYKKTHTYMFSLSATQRGVVVAPTAATLKTTKRSSSARRASKLQAKEAEAEADADADAEATGDDSEDASSEEKPKDRGIFKMFAPDGEVNASDYNKFKAKMEEEKKRKQEEYAKKGKKKFLGLF